MEWLKFGIEKLFTFLAALIPGAAVLVLFAIHHPDWARAFRDINYLGYNTKIALALGLAFVAGWTVGVAYAATAAGIEAALAAWFPRLVEAIDPKTPPWRSKNWRALVQSYLGKAAPEDLEIVSDEVLKIQIQTANFILDPQQRANEIMRLTRAKTAADLVDFDWRGWWDTLHNETIFDFDAVTQMALTVEANLQAASILLLFSLFSTPSLRHWWIVTPCLFWVAMRALRTFSIWRQFRDPWTSFMKQMSYLRGKKLAVDAADQKGATK